MLFYQSDSGESLLYLAANNTKLMRLKILYIFLICYASCFSQQVAVKELLQEAESKFWDAPEYSIRIAEYILTQHEKEEFAAEANLILAKSYFVQDKTYEAAKASFEAQKLAEKTEAVSLITEAKLFNLHLLQKLLLTTVSEDIEKQINLPKHKDKRSVFIDNQLILSKAEWALQNEDLSTSENFFNAVNVTSLPSNSIENLRVEIGKAQVKFKQSHTEEALKILEQLPSEMPKYFQALKLNLLGEIYFRKHQYNQAISIWNEAKEIAGELSNKELANQSLEGLVQIYLIQEDSKKYLDYKQESNLMIAELTTDRVRAVNFIYNHFENLQEEAAHKDLTFAQKKVYITAIVFILLALIIWGLNYYYRLRIKEYNLFKKLISTASPLPKKENGNKNSVSEDTEKHLLKALKNFESGTDFIRPDMSIAFLAAHLNTNTKYLSGVINRHKEKNFNSYINELRINYIIHKLKTDPIYLNYKISYLAEESGFSSHSSFTTVFKSVTGISPTKFIGFLQKEGNHEK